MYQSNKKCRNVCIKCKRNTWRTNSITPPIWEEYITYKYKLKEIDIIFDSIQELKEYLSFPYKVETYKGFDIYRRLINEDDMEVSYYFEYKTIHNIYNPTLYDIKELKIIIDYLYN